MSLSSFLRELRRRHVHRVAVAYVVTGGLLVQLASIMLPAYGAPPQALRAVIGMFLLFLPVSLVIAWAFEVTPEGVRRTVPVGVEGARAAPSGRGRLRPIDWVIIAMVVAAVGLLAWRLTRSTVEPAHVAAADRALATPSDLPVSAPATMPPRSIAVLPFESLSEDKANAYFASGIQDMILTRLVGIGDLTVVSRSSTESYGSHPGDLRTAGRELGVANVLEGSVQRAGRQVLINVQLIDARTDHHLWAASYTRTLDNIFGVESEVAQKIAAALNARLTPAEEQRVTATATTDTAALDLYLRADAHALRAYDQNALSRVELTVAIPLLQQALARDPGFALAAAALARANMYMYWFGADRTDARLAAARSAAQLALGQQPDLGEAHYALALYDYWGFRDYAGALRELELARSTLPNSSDVEMLLAAVARRRGQWDRAVTAFGQAAVLDPRSAAAPDQLALTYASLRRYAEADRAYQKAAALARDPADERVGRGQNTVRWTGDLAPLGAALDSVTRASPSYTGDARDFFWFDWWSRDYAAAIEKARSDASDGWSDQSNVVLPRRLYLAWAQEAAGDTAGAKVSYAAVRSALAAAVAGRPDDAELHLGLGFALAGLGLGDEAAAEGRRAAGLMPTSRDAFSGTAYMSWLARLYVRVGRTGQALELLRSLLERPAGLDISPALLRLDPNWDPLRKEPAFQALLNRPASPADPAAAGD